MDSDIGIRVKELRENKGMTQEELAERLSFSRSAWKAREDGTVDFKTGLIIELSQIFNVSTDFILTGQDSQNVSPVGSSAMPLLRRRICRMINRESHSVQKSQYWQGYVYALSRVVHLIDKINMEKAGKKNDPADDYDQHRYSGLLTED